MDTYLKYHKRRVRKGMKPLRDDLLIRLRDAETNLSHYVIRGDDNTVALCRAAITRYCELLDTVTLEPKCGS